MARKPKPLRFPSVDALRAWLRDSNDGKEIIGAIREEIESRRDRKRVLVLLHADGWVEVYGDANVDVHMALVPNDDDEAGAEEVVDSTLPRRFQDMIWPNQMGDNPGLIKFLQCRGLSSFAMYKMKEALAILRELKG